MMRVVINKGTSNLSVENGGNNLVKLAVYVDSQPVDDATEVPVAPSGYGIIVNREELNRAISFVMGDNLPPILEDNNQGLLDKPVFGSH